MSHPNIDDDNGVQREKPRRRGRFLFVLFLLVVIALSFAGGYLIRVYFKSSEPQTATATSQQGGALEEIKEQWRDHNLPLDIKSLTKMWEDMRDDMEKQKIPQLKDKLENLKAQIEEKKKTTKPELEAEWKKVSEKVDSLLASLQDKREDWAEKFSEVQDETKQLLEKEIDKLDGASPTPAPEVTP